MPNIWKAVALLMVTFAGGVLTGRALGARPVTDAEAGGPMHEHGPEGFVSFLSDSLGLSPVQQDSVRAVLERYRPAMDSVWHEMEPRFETLRSTIRSEIRSQLTPDQQPKFVDLMARHDARHARTGR